MLFINEPERSLPVVPTLLASEQTTQYKRTYEQQSDNLGNKFRLDAARISLNKTVVREDLRDRQKHAHLDARAAMALDPRQKREFLTLRETDIHVSDPQERASAFLTAQYLPSFELYARLAIGERTGPIDSKMAELAFQLLAEEHDELAVVNDEPTAHVKVVSLTSRNDQEFAVISNKSAGLTLTDGKRNFDLKHQRTGVLPLKGVGKDILENVKLLARAAQIEGATEEQLTWFRQNLTDYLLDGTPYFPVIDRFYLNLTSSAQTVSPTVPESPSGSPQSDA
jgi:hypothetical protein